MRMDEAKKTIRLPEAGLLSWYVEYCLPGFSLISYTHDPETRDYTLHIETTEKEKKP